MKEITLNVEGMHCEGCSNRIQNSVSSLEGVESVVADYNNGIVIVKCNEELNEEEIKETLDELGFEVKE